MADLRIAAQQALEFVTSKQWGTVPYMDGNVYSDAKELEGALRAALLEQQAEPVLQTCNCRWDGDVQVQQCTLHEAHVDAIHEWAERAKVAERKLAQQAEPVQEPFALPCPTPKACREHCCSGHCIPRATSPQQAEPVQRKPLTDAEIEIIHSAVGNA